MPVSSVSLIPGLRSAARRSVRKSVHGRTAWPRHRSERPQWRSRTGPASASSWCRYFRGSPRASPFGKQQLHAGVILGGEISRISLRENRLFLINQLVKLCCFLHFLSFGAIPRLNYGFCVRDPTPLSGPEGHRDSDRPTVIGTQPCASPSFMFFTSNWTKTAQVVRFF